MQPLIEFFGAKDLIPHGYCLSWSPLLLWLHVSSDILITLAYFSIPLILIYFLRQKKGLAYPWLIAMFASFIIACGSTHLLSAITIWIPLYWLDGLLKGLTAILSVASALVMIWVTPRLLSLPSNKQLQEELQRRRDLEDALLESENKLATVLDSVEAFIYVKDSNYQYRYVNQAVRQLFGKTLTEIIGKSDEDFFDQTTVVTLREHDRRVLELGERVAIENIYTSKENNLITQAFFTVNQPLYSKDGNIYGVCGITTEITEQKHQEQKDKEHLAQLAHATRLGLMGEMAAGIAHEVNQPLAAISTYAQVSLNLIKAESPDLEKLTEILTKTQQQAVRAGQIIHRMKEFAKSDSKHHLSADINALINEAVDLCSAELKLNEIKLTLDLGKNLSAILVDHIQIEQVLINLIRNSVEVLQNLAGDQQRQITIESYLNPHNAIQVRVKDNGLGLEEDQRKKIFMPFYTTKPDGMGMGLSISRSLIEAHEGSLGFNSEPGKGTTFYFTLPTEKKGAVSELS